MYVETHGGAALFHPAFPDWSLKAYRGDLEILAKEGLLLLSQGSKGTLQFDITPAGSQHHEHLGKREDPDSPSFQNGIKSAAGLHPWGIVCGFLFAWDSDEVINIISMAGIHVDWSVTTRESFSSSTRKRVYRPRVDAAVFKLNTSEKLRAAWVVSSELVRRHPEIQKDFHQRLSAIGWAFDDDSIRPTSGEVAELFFPKGSEHDAYIRLREIIQSAQSSIMIVDPYMDSSILTILGTSSRSLVIQLLSHTLPNDFAHEIGTFKKQYCPQSIEVRRAREFHDRFIVIDGTRCFHVGASIKDAGGRAFMISQVQDEANVHAILDQAQLSWDGATQGITHSQTPRLSKNPSHKPGDDLPSIRGESSTVFFSQRFAKAFPGARGITWFRDPIEAVKRLNIFFTKPFSFRDAQPIWWWRSGEMYIQNFSTLSADTVLIDHQEIVIHELAAVNKGSYYQEFLYIKAKPSQPSGLFDNARVPDQITLQGYAGEEFALFRGRAITRAEYDDGAAVIDGNVVDLNGEAILRERFLTPYNLIIAAHESPINNDGFDQPLETLLNQILRSEATLEELTKAVLKLPRREYYNRP
jgi:hypothetical protein